MNGENFCWLVVGVILGRFIGDSARDFARAVIAADREKNK